MTQFEFNNYLDNVMNKTERCLLAWQSVARMLLHSTHAYSCLILCFAARNFGVCRAAVVGPGVMLWLAINEMRKLSGRR